MGVAYDPKFRIHCYNIKSFESQFDNIDCILGDATNLKSVPDQEFDIAFSNSVIEHMGTYDKQEKMAHEIRRVSKYYFIQTPNFWFPIEPHARLPFIQFLPLTLGSFIVLLKKGGRLRDLQMIRSWIGNIRLLRKKELLRLFPDGMIIKERFLIWAKSFIIHNMPEKTYNNC